VNRRKLSGALSPRHCKLLQHAWTEADRLGLPLNQMLTIKPLGDLSPAANAGLVERLWNKLGVWSRYHGRFCCILVREKQLSRPEHIHALIHVPLGKSGPFAETLARWFPPDVADIDIRPAHQTVKWTTSGKIRSALGYLTKQRSPQAAWGTPSYSRQRGVDRVLGKRYRITRNLLPVATTVMPTLSMRGSSEAA
jgi:hypothetical protein